MLSYRIQINIFIVVTIVSNSLFVGTKAETSMCSCSEKDIMSLRKISDMDARITSNTEQVQIWTENREFVKRLSLLWDDGLEDIIETLMKKHSSRIPKLPNSESTVTRPEVVKPASSVRPKPPAEDNELAKNMSNLLVKLENVENRTLEVEEELTNEQSIRRLLQKEVNETQTSLISLRKQLHNLIAPVDSVLSNVQKIVSSIENMNRTIYEDHLQKLYDTVDGVVYKNETRKLGERIDHIEKEIRGGWNSSIISKLSNDVKNLEGNLQIINASVTNDLVPRIMMLDSETARKDTVKDLEQKVTYLLNITEEFKIDLMWHVTRIRRTADTCDVPVSNDPHLLVDIEREPDGTRRLIFGCRPIGQYAVSSPPTPVRCEGGTWRGSYPTCRALPGASKVEQLYEELMKEYPCTEGTEVYPDPTDCSRFFNCSSGIRYCPEKHSFDSNLKKCVISDGHCIESSSGPIPELQNLIPHIDIEPNNVDKPGGLLGTGSAGQLTVYPQSNFTLNCLYPEFFRGYPHWEITYPNLQPGSRPIKPRELGKNKVGLIVISAVEEDTGLYRCITPFGKSHGIYVSVKAVQCPPFPIDEKYEDVFYTPIPEGEVRILGSTAEFPCMKGKEYAICMADGKWSKVVPECPLRKRCKLPDTADNKDLILKEVLDGKYVAFECDSGLNLVGDSQMRCLGNGTWRPSSLPVCVK